MLPARAPRFSHGKEQLPVFTRTRDGRLMESEQDIQCKQRRSDVFGAAGCGNDGFCRDASGTADALVHVLDGVLINHVEVARSPSRLRNGKRKHEEITLRFEHMIGLMHRLDPAAVLETTL